MDNRSNKVEGCIGRLREIVLGRRMAPSLFACAVSMPPFASETYQEMFSLGLMG